MYKCFVKLYGRQSIGTEEAQPPKSQ